MNGTGTGDNSVILRHCSRLALVKVGVNKAQLHDYKLAMRHLLLLWAYAILPFALPGAGYAQNFRVTLLGTGNPRPGIERFGASTLVEVGNEKLLVDCGRGATQRIYQLKIPFNEVDALFLTHLHSDHTVGIPDLWLTGWIMGRGVPLRVWGPAGTGEMISHLKRAYAFDVHTRRDVDEKLPVEGAVIKSQEIREGVVYERGEVKVTAFLVDHGPVQPAFGYRVDYAGHSVTLSGDTRFSENLIRFAQGTDLLIHEVLDPEAYQEISNTFTAAQRQKVIAHHITPEQAGVVFTRVKPKLAVYSHIVPPDAPDLIAHTRKTYSGPLEVGEDLTSIEIGQKIEVHRRNH
jgi:ribonuclease Z